MNIQREIDIKPLAARANSVQLFIICYDSTGSVLPFPQSTTAGESIEASQSTTVTVNMIPSETQDMELIVDCATFEQTPTETPPTTTTPPTTQPDTPDPENDSETGGIPGFPIASIALGSLIALAVTHRKPEI